MDRVKLRSSFAMGVLWMFTTTACTGGHASAHPTVSVRPASRLRAGQTVNVKVSGFRPGAKVFLSECPGRPAVTSLGCGGQLAAQPFVAITDSGGGESTFIVDRDAGTDKAPCAPTCFMVATQGADGPFAATPIAFAGA
jgi:hypothetical protein